MYQDKATGIWIAIGYTALLGWDLLYATPTTPDVWKVKIGRLRSGSLEPEFREVFTQVIYLPVKITFPKRKK